MSDQMSAQAPYMLAFMSSTAVEIVAIAVVFTLLTLAIVRSVFRTNATNHRWLRVYRAVDSLKLYKMIIPLACLTGTVWVWSLIQGV